MSIAVESLFKAFELFEKYSKCPYSSDQVTDSFIHQTERMFGLKIPPTYRLFLKRYGCYGFFATEFFGITPEAIESDGDFENVKDLYDAFALTLDARKKWDLPLQYIIVGNPGYGPLDAIDTSKPDDNGECPVVMIEINDEDPVTKEKEWYEMEQLAPDFGTYLYNQSKQALQNAIDNGDVEG
jgi:hypothetical protein